MSKIQYLYYNVKRPYQLTLMERLCSMQSENHIGMPVLIKTSRKPAHCVENSNVNLVTKVSSRSNKFLSTVTKLINNIIGFLITDHDQHS